MKIVINRRCGGFGLSHEAMLKYFEYNGWKCYLEKDKRGSYTYWKVPKDQRQGILSSEEFTKASIEDRKKSNLLYSSLSVYPGDLNRDDKILVKVVEELGSKANGEYASLTIADIPDDVEWQIEEYDGNEWVAEVHRTWS
jgi:hypothetical protein